MFAQRLIGDSPLQEKRSGIDSEDGVDAAFVVVAYRCGCA